MGGKNTYTDEELNQYGLTCMEIGHYLSNKAKLAIFAAIYNEFYRRVEEGVFDSGNEGLTPDEFKHILEHETFLSGSEIAGEVLEFLGEKINYTYINRNIQELAKTPLIDAHIDRTRGGRILLANLSPAVAEIVLSKPNIVDHIRYLYDINFSKIK